jgi:hypothetical protein
MHSSHQKFLAKACLWSLSTTYVVSLCVSMAFMAWHAYLKHMPKQTGKTVFVVSNDEYNKHFADRSEFSYKHGLYDIESILQIDGDSVEIIAHLDNFEMELFSFVSQITDTSGDDNFPSRLIMLWSIVFIMPKEAEFIIYNTGNEQHPLNFAVKLYEYHWSNTIEYPPAKLA